MKFSFFHHDFIFVVISNNKVILGYDILPATAIIKIKQLPAAPATAAAVTINAVCESK